MKTIPRFIALGATLSILMAAQSRGQSALDGFDPNANGTVRVVLVQPDGKILIGGDFTTLAPNGGATVTRNRIARLNPDGTLDTGFNPNASNVVRALALQPDGKILVAGDFSGASSIGGQTRDLIARLDPVTGAADSFNASISAPGSLLAVAVQADGKILAGGQFNLGPQPRRLARLNSDGSLDSSFDPNPNNNVATIVLQPNGDILVGGSFTNVGGQTRNRIARINPITALADSFDPNANGAVNAIALQADGKILAGGDFTGIGGQSRIALARLDPTNGFADALNQGSANSLGPNSSVKAIAIQPDGDILAGGDLRLEFSPGAFSPFSLQRLSGATSFENLRLDSPSVLTIALQLDGKILTGGDFLSALGQTRNRIARLETGGALDRTLNLSLVGATVLATAVQPDGKILVGGQFTNVLGAARNNIARLNRDGTLDSTFNPNANNIVRAIAVEADGKIVVAGDFNGANSIGGQTRNLIARLDPVTGAAVAFNDNTSLSGSIAALAVQADGKILAGGQVNEAGVAQPRYFARFNSNGSLDSAFNPNANADVAAIAIQSNGLILVGGNFTTIGGQPRNRIARLDPVTALADSFNPSANDVVRSIVVQSDGKIVVGGHFGSIGGQARTRLARLDPISGTADSFNPLFPDAGDDVLAVAVQTNGSIIAGGNFFIYASRFDLARFDGVSSSPDSFNPSPNGIVRSIALQTDGKILIGGSFPSSGGQTRNRFARLSNDTAAAQELTATDKSVLWTRSGSSPPLTRVVFEFSTNAVTYTSLGNGVPVGSNWSLTGFNLPFDQNLYVRARGFLNGSQIITESVRNIFLAQPRPIITSPFVATATVGQPFVYQFETINADSRSVTNLPPGLTFNSTLAAITGKPTGTGTFSLGLNATNSFGTTSATLTLTVQPPPTAGPLIASSTAATGRVGQPFRFQVYTIGGTSAARVSASDLPPGLSIDPVTGVISGTPTFAGSTPVTLTVTEGASTTSSILELTVTSDPALPVIAGSDTVLLTPGQFVSYVISAPSTAGPSDPTIYTLVGTLPAGLSFDPNTGTISSTYAGVMESRHGNRPDVPDLSGGALLGSVQLFATNSHGTSTFQLLFLASPSGTVNISTRLLVGTGENVLIGGFIVTGDAPKVVIARAIGPSTGVPGALQDPVLELHDSVGHVVVNDNWKDTQKDLIVASTVPPLDDRESAIVIGLDPGTYTAILSGKDGETGIAVAEVYDLGTASLASSASAKLANISTRGFVLTGNDVMIGGFIVQRTSTKVIMRAIGPSLSQSGVQGTLQDPVLELRDGSGSLIVSNDDWRSTQEQQIIDTTVPPKDDRESAIVATLIPGNYTAIVQGKNNSTGVALVEVYQLQ